jgi:transcriptional regulator with XRE-family HTH domain
MMTNRQDSRNSSAGSRIADRVRACRAAAGWSQFELAARARLSLQTVGLVERSGLITERTAERLSIALGVSAEELRP